MIKDITIGQYIPGETFVHKLDPRTKIILSILFIVSLFIVDKFIGYILIVGFLGAALMLGIKVIDITLTINNAISELHIFLIFFIFIPLTLTNVFFLLDLSAFFHFVFEIIHMLEQIILNHHHNHVD